jgi:molybdopterin converting factor small subunit
MEVKVLFFARSRELAGATEAIMSLPEGATTLDLQAQLLLQVRAAACRALPLGGH